MLRCTKTGENSPAARQPADAIDRVVRSFGICLQSAGSIVIDNIGLYKSLLIHLLGVPMLILLSESSHVGDQSMVKLLLFTVATKLGLYVVGTTILRVIDKNPSFGWN